VPGIDGEQVPAESLAGCWKSRFIWWFPWDVV